MIPLMLIFNLFQHLMLSSAKYQYHRTVTEHSVATLLFFQVLILRRISQADKPRQLSSLSVLQTSLTPSVVLCRMLRVF